MSCAEGVRVRATVRPIVLQRERIGVAAFDLLVLYQIVLRKL